MQIRSNTLTEQDIRETFAESCSPVGGYIDEFRSGRGRHAKFTYTLYAGSVNGKRARNGRPGRALTYEDYGRWFGLLFEIDPEAWVSGWDGASDFHARTDGRFYPEKVNA